MAAELESLRIASHTAKRTPSTENWRLEGMRVNYHSGLSVMQVEKYIPLSLVEDFLKDMASKEAYYEVSAGQELDKEFVGKVMTKRANEKNPKVYFRDQEKLFGKKQLDLQTDGLEFSDVLPVAMERAPGKKLCLKDKLCYVLFYIYIIICIFIFVDRFKYILYDVWSYGDIYINAF